MPRKLTRLFIGSDLFQGQKLSLNLKESHYLNHVLKLRSGDSFLLFNGRDGEWHARVIQVLTKQVHIEVSDLAHAQKEDVPLCLFFAPLKSGPLGFLVEKATELGVTELQPLWTARTQGRDFNNQRYFSIIREAAEQSGRMTIPILHLPLSLEEVLTQWKQEKSLLVCDERKNAQSLWAFLQKEETMPNSVMIGPEGGFTPQEFHFLGQFPWITFISLGDNILRAETAALSALSLLHVKISGGRNILP